MARPTKDDDAAAVPDSRMARMMRLGGLTSGLVSDMAVSGLRQLAQGKRPRLQDMAMTPMTARRITRDLRVMRGAAMKIGQMVSMDPGLVLPPEMTSILAALRDEARHMPPAQLRDVLDDAWGKDWRKRFTRFDVRPFAAASIGQVHRARTIDGRDMAIKVQYPAVRESIDSDIDNIATILRVSGMLPRGMNIAPLLANARQQLHEEADYTAEAEKLQAFRDVLAPGDRFVLPDFYADFSTPQVLAMQYIDCVPIDSLKDAPQDLRDRIAQELVTLVLRELFDFNMMQTDPNLANYRYDPVSQRIVLLDFGAVMQIDPTVATKFRRLLQVALDRDHTATEQAMQDIGYFDTTTTLMQRDLIMQMFDVAMAPLRHNEPFDFGTSALVSDLRDMGIALGRGRDMAHVPPAEILFLHRKIGGIYLVAAMLRAKLSLNALVMPFRP